MSELAKKCIETDPSADIATAQGYGLVHLSFEAFGYQRDSQGVARMPSWRQKSTASMRKSPPALLGDAFAVEGVTDDREKKPN